MKDKRITQAWDTVNPTGEQKRRIRAALEEALEEREGFAAGNASLLPDKPGQRGSPYYARPPKRNRFRALSAAAAVLALICGFLLGRISLEQDTPEAIQSTGTTETVPVKEIRYSTYDQILEVYVTALEEGWSAQQCAQAEISESIAWFMEYPLSLGYAYQDLNGDGREELLITNGERIYDLYTQTEEGAAHPLMGFDRIRYYLCEDHYIAMEGSGGAAEQHYAFYQLAGEELVLEEQILYKSQENPESPWFLGDEGGGEVSITQREAWDRIAAYRHVEVEFTAFDVEAPQMPECYASLLDTYRTALEDGWDVQRCEEQGISKQIALSGLNGNQLGYSLRDLDQNGDWELIITDGSLVYDLYTCGSGEEARQLLSAGVTSTYELDRENNLYQTEMVSAILTDYRRYHLSNGQLQQDFYLRFAASSDTGSRWFQPDDQGNYQPVSTEEANALVGDFQGDSLVFLPLAEQVNSEEALLNAYAQEIPQVLRGDWNSGKQSYCFYDCDGDGAEELLLGEEEALSYVLQPRAGTGETIFIECASFVTEEGSAWLCRGNVLQTQWEVQGTIYFRYSQLEESHGSIQMKDVDFLYYVTGKDTWWDLTQDNKTVTRDYANRIRGSYPRLDLDWKPLEEFPVALSE